MVLTLKDYTLLEILPEGPYTGEFDFKGVYTDAAGVEHNVEVFNNDYFIEHCAYLYGSRLITLPSNLIAARAMFEELFTQWKNSRKDLFFKQAYAYQLKYNPIENYSSTEQLIDDTTEHEKGASHKVDYHNKDADTLTPFTKITDETTPYTKEETTTTPYTKVTNETTPYTKEETTTTGATSGVPSSSTTNSRMAFNSNSFVGTDKSETDTNSKTEFKKTGTEKTDTTWTGTEKIELKKTGTEKLERTYTGTEKHEIEHTGYVETTTDGSDTDTRNYTLTKKGNIGTMTASQMLQSEYDGLIQDLARRALEEFIDRYTFYSVSVD